LLGSKKYGDNMFIRKEENNSKSGKAKGRKKRQCDDKLKQCQTELEQCKNDPEWLFVQLGSQCSIIHEGEEEYTLHVKEMNIDTWFFTLQTNPAMTASTAEVTDEFETMFPGDKPNAAVTFVSEDGDYDGPLISVFLEAATHNNDEDNNDDDTVSVSYKLYQSDDQKSVASSFASYYSMLLFLMMEQKL